MIRTIIVDDEILSRIGIQSFIDGEKDVIVAGAFGTAEEAIEYLKVNPVDIVITDIEMADMNGLEFIRVIREMQLADGVIIVSCHDDFAYAQEAIEHGTDSYILKHNVSKDALLKELRKVYEKTHKDRKTENIGDKLFSTPFDMTGTGCYTIGVLRARVGNYTAEDSRHMEGAMLVHLLDGIVSRYKMGTLFAPYNKEIFVIFQFEQGMSQEERQELLSANLTAINKNIRQYLNGDLLIGISTEFENLQETKQKYEEAAEAVSRSFYEPEKSIFSYRKYDKSYSCPVFSTDVFSGKNGMSVFEHELDEILQNAHFLHMPVAALKEQLIQRVNLMTYQISKQLGLGENAAQRWDLEVLYTSDVSAAKDRYALKETLMNGMKKFYDQLRSEMEKDDLAAALSHIEQNLQDKITLSELAEVSCMSVPSFCKKFKDRTGQTLVQYMNLKRIERAKELLKNKNYSLWEISEMTGFSNTNYLIRVFKKVTGETVSEYRKRYGIVEKE